MLLQPQAPTVLRGRIIALPAVTLTLGPQTPVSLRARIIELPAVTLTLDPQAPTTSLTINTNVSLPAVTLTLGPQAPTTLRGLISALPPATLTLEPQAPSTLRDRIALLPVVTLTLDGQAPTVTSSATPVVTVLDLLSQLLTDLAVFFPGDGTGFDQDVTGPDGVIRGVYTDESVEGSDRDGPHLWIKESDIGTIVEGSQLTIESRVHWVAYVRPDGVDLIHLLLEQRP